jgi:hypothetical protein
MDKFTANGGGKWKYAMKHNEQIQVVVGKNILFTAVPTVELLKVCACASYGKNVMVSM